MISIVIPTYYRHERLKGLLSALQVQSHAPGEIVIVDQTPEQDRPVDFYNQFSNMPLMLVNLDKPSLSASRNTGARRASGEFLLFLDDDMVIGPDLLKNHKNVMEHEHVDVVYGAISTGKDLPETYERDTQRLDPLGFFLKSPNKKWNGMVLVTSGANTLIKREYFLRVGGFDEKMPRMEDIELGYRLFLAGAKIYYSALPHAIHDAASSGGTRKTQKNMTYSRLLSKIYLYQKHFSGWTAQQFYLLVIKNALTYRDPISGAFFLANLRQILWPVQTLLMLRKAHRNALLLLENQ